jgi:hypothetical protein
MEAADYSFTGIHSSFLEITIVSESFFSATWQDLRIQVDIPSLGSR